MYIEESEDWPQKKREDMGSTLSCLGHPWISGLKLYNNVHCNPLSRLRAYICVATAIWNIDVPFDNMQINSEPWYIIFYPMEASSTLTGCPCRPAIWLAIILYPIEAGSTLTGYHKANIVLIQLAPGRSIWVAILSFQLRSSSKRNFASRLLLIKYST